MKAFLIKLGLFLGGFVLIALAIDRAFMAAVRTVKADEFGVLNAVAAGAVRAEMLVCGNSRAVAHFDPQILARETGFSCFNLGQEGTGLGVQLAVLKWFLDLHPPPRFLIQNIDVFGANVERSIYMPFKYLPYLADAALFDGLALVDRGLWLHRSLPFTNLLYFNPDFQRILVKGLLHTRSRREGEIAQAYKPNTGPWRGDEAELERLAGGVASRITRSHRNSLDALITLCRGRGIQLILVLSPEYGRLRTLNLNRDEILGFYERLSRENGLWLFDYSLAFPGRDRELFVDHLHMNVRGAELFSRDLARAIKDRIDGRAGAR